ncbi:MAG: hypothetical protein ACK56I_10495, partial [bacterium]
MRRSVQGDDYQGCPYEPYLRPHPNEQGSAVGEVKSICLEEGGMRSALGTGLSASAGAPEEHQPSPVWPHPTPDDLLEGQESARLVSNEQTARCPAEPDHRVKQHRKARRGRRRQRSSSSLTLAAVAGVG